MNPESWEPVGIEFLEPAARKALRYSGNSYVVAGPGAGKTEFLAQRATYLLQTGLCPPPYRILAISFKTDAADNLERRVRQRCPPEQASRFISKTFDAFTKGLVDRFYTVLPRHWRPICPYEIAFPTYREIGMFLKRIRMTAKAGWHVDIMKINNSKFESHVLGTYNLPNRAIEPSSGVEFAIHKWWSTYLFGNEVSSLTFTMFNRLAELLLRACPQILRALRRTYPFVFVDEFQDTTHAQYDFLLTAFGNSSTTLTAVGDDKQRIMEWAGARPDAFRHYQRDFHAERFQLLANFRSCPDLVRIQHVVARTLDPTVVKAESYAKQSIDSDVAQIWTHQSNLSEAIQIAKWIANDMQLRNMRPRDYALLVRQKAERFESGLASAFDEMGIRLRNESRKLGKLSLQELFAEEITQIGLAILRLAVQRQEPAAWDKASLANLHLRAADMDDEVACYHAERYLTGFLQKVRRFISDTKPEKETVQQLTEQLFSFLDPSIVARTYIKYGTGDILHLAIDSFILHLVQSAAGAEDWVSCLDAFEGVDQVPLMTIHKSKGLEFDTIIFVGLDDKAWWSYSSDNPEGMATFFVALSRAKQRAIFTYCKERGTRVKVKDLYALLAEAGVLEYHY